MSSNVNFENLIKLKFDNVKKKKSNTIDNKKDNDIIEQNKNINNNSNKDDKRVTKEVTNNNENTLHNFTYNKLASTDDDPVRKLNEIDEKFDTLELYEAPESLGLETKEVPEFNEEENRKELERLLKDVYDNKRNSELDKYQSSIDNLNSLKADKTNNFISSEKEINKIYDNESFKLKSDAIKRGLARSSIIIENLANVESQRAEKLNDNLVTLNNNLLEIESKINNLNSSLDNALEKLDIDMADELEKQLLKKYAEYEKEYNSAIEFNNQVKQAEAEYKIKYENEKQKFKKSLIENAANGFDEYYAKKRQAKVNYMMAYLDLFDKDMAMELFYRNSAYKDLLGEDYDKIVSYLNSRM